MARPLRIEFSGAVYHITSRGDGRDDIFLSDADREIFLGVLDHVVERFGWLCHAYCLMTNHYHLLIETPKANLSQGMRQLNGVYTQRFNRSHHRVGHVFQGRFNAILVEKDAYLLELCRYIVRNPVVSAMVADISEWPWSSYRATAGLVYAPKLLSISWVLQQFDGKTERYQEFITEDEDIDSPLGKAEETHVLGGEQFRNDVQQYIKADSEVPRSQRFMARKRLNELKADVSERGEWMAQAYRQYGYTMKEIADYEQVHYSSVSKLIKAWEGR